MVIDRRSGQVYEETVMGPPVGFVNGIAWEHESPFLDVDYEDCSARGVPTLKHLAMKETLSDQRNLSQSHFLHVPWPIAKQLWEYLTRSGKRTMYMWKILCATYPTEFRHISQHWRMLIDKPRIPMRDYISLVKNTDCSWATQLSIWTEFAWTPELVELADVINLVSLEVNTSTVLSSTISFEEHSQEVATLDDRILRAWAELVETSGSFRYLRVLKLYGQRNLTGHAFRYLSEFPSLEYFIVAMCQGLTTKSAIKMAEEHGWLVSEDKPEGTAYQISKITSTSWFHAYGEWDNKRADGLIPSSLPSNIPLLEFTVGQRRERMRDDLDVVIFCRKRDTRANKRKNEDRLPTPENNRFQRQAKKPALKERGRDLSGLLGEFM